MSVGASFYSEIIAVGESSKRFNLKDPRVLVGLV